MDTIDFSRSFITWRVDCSKKRPETLTHEPPYDLNNARVQVDCYCKLKEKQTGVAHEFALGASCKSEIVGAERNLWREPNADFIPVMSRDYFMVLKAFDCADKGAMLDLPSHGLQPERQVVSTHESFDSTRMDIVYCPARVLQATERIVESTLANHPLNAHTQIESQRYVADIIYPVKTMNANERDQIYQTDTGPVLFPDLNREPEDLISGLELAFAAFNTESWTEFLLRIKVPVAEGVSVYHYSQSIHIECKNQIILPQRHQ